MIPLRQLEENKRHSNLELIQNQILKIVRAKTQSSDQEANNDTSASETYELEIEIGELEFLEQQCKYDPARGKIIDPRGGFGGSLNRFIRNAESFYFYGNEGNEKDYFALFEGLHTAKGGEPNDFNKKDVPVTEVGRYVETLKKKGII